MKLYTFEIAPNPQRVQLLLKHKGVSLNTETVDLSKGEQFSEEFRAINPACTVPVLELDDGSTLTEVIAICQFLDNVYPHKPLFGHSVLENAQVVQWMHRNFVEGFMSIADMLRNRGRTFADHALPGPHKTAQIPELVERGRDLLHLYFRRLDRHLQDRTHLVGNELTQADIDACVTCDFASWVKETVPAEYEHLNRWRQQTARELGLQDG